MVFSSSIFLFIFLPVTLLGYYLLKKEYRSHFLLLMSMLFYAWGEPRLVVVMLCSILLNYLMGLLIAFVQKRFGKAAERLALFLAVLTNLSILFYFKYLDFFITTVNGVFSVQIPLRNIVLPIGISFYTFQAMSYVIDLYRGQVKLQKNPLKLALYISLFPQLIAGPIVRYIDVANQIDNRTLSADKFALGIRRFVIGLAKKAVIANQVALVADTIFDKTNLQISTGTAWVGILCYSIQIYFDFSGYSDMAIGMGKMFGFDFLENFSYPYISRSITEFWRKWHISLSSWFRDYVYIPLGGNRTGNVYVNLLIVFIVTGMWHGASWNFIVWGLWHGLFLILERLARKHNSRGFHLPGIIQWLYTMIVVVMGWVLFRAPDLSSAVQYLSLLFGFSKASGTGFTVFWYLTPKTAAILIIAAVASIPWKRVFPKIEEKLETSTVALSVQAVGLMVLLAVSVMSVMTSTYNPFIYFRF